MRSLCQKGGGVDVDQDPYWLLTHRYNKMISVKVFANYFLPKKIHSLFQNVIQAPSPVLNWKKKKDPMKRTALKCVYLRKYLVFSLLECLLCLRKRLQSPPFIYRIRQSVWNDTPHCRLFIILSTPLRWFQRGRLKLDEDLKFSENVHNNCRYLSNGGVRKQLTVLFLRYLIAKLGGNALALTGVWKNGWQFVEFWFFTSELDEGGKNLFNVKIGILGTI